MGLQKYNPYEDLSPKHQKAVDLRLEFYKYKFIAFKLKVQEQTVAEWFMEGGICKAAYDWKIENRKRENEEMNAKIRQELQDLSPEAILVLKQAMSKGDARTALEILAINGIVVTQKIEVDLGNKEKIEEFSNLIDEVSQYARRQFNKGNTKPS